MLHLRNLNNFCYCEAWTLLANLVMNQLRIWMIDSSTKINDRFLWKSFLFVFSSFFFSSFVHFSFYRHFFILNWLTNNEEEMASSIKQNINKPILCQPFVLVFLYRRWKYFSIHGKQNFPDSILHHMTLYKSCKMTTACL